MKQKPPTKKQKEEQKKPSAAPAQNDSIPPVPDAPPNWHGTADMSTMAATIASPQDAGIGITTNPEIADSVDRRPDVPATAEQAAAAQLTETFLEWVHTLGYGSAQGSGIRQRRTQGR